MNRFSRTEFLLLNYLYQKEIGAGTGSTLLETELDLQETDEINKVRELVFYLEKLERESVLETDPEFYLASDHMSFTYLNSAVELYEDRIRLSDAGRQLIVGYMESGKSKRFFNAFNRMMEAPDTRYVMLGFAGIVFLMGLVFGYAAGRIL